MDPTTAAATMRGPVTVILVGAGARGKTYARYAIENPAAMKIVAVAEPRAFHRHLVAERHGLAPACVLEDWGPLAAQPRFADAVIIATQDAMHVEPCLAFLSRGYHVLLEKPMALSPTACRAIADAVKAAGVLFAVGHVLRYTPYTQRMVEIIRSGAIGDVVNIQHMEPIGSWHFAHSYVRGPWARSDKSTFLLMSKCCHDMDVIRYLMGRSCVRVASFGALTQFRPEKAPLGAAARCLDCGIESSCAFSAKRLYLERAMAGYTGWPVATICDGEPSIENIHTALAQGPYGRCVWQSDNNVNDHQVVCMQFEGGASATLTTVAFTEAVCVRRTRICGSRGEVEGDGLNTLRVYDFLTGTATVFETAGPPAHTAITGHNGADFFLIDAFIKAVYHNDPSYIRSGVDDTLESHLMVFAAECARLTNSTVDLTSPDTLTKLDALFPMQAASADADDDMADTTDAISVAASAVASMRLSVTAATPSTPIVRAALEADDARMTNDASPGDGAGSNNSSADMLDEAASSASGVQPFTPAAFAMSGTPLPSPLFPPAMPPPLLDALTLAGRPVGALAQAETDLTAESPAVL